MLNTFSYRKLIRNDYKPKVGFTLLFSQIRHTMPTYSLKVPFQRTRVCGDHKKTMSKKKFKVSARSEH